MTDNAFLHYFTHVHYVQKSALKYALLRTAFLLRISITCIIYKAYALRFNISTAAQLKHILRHFGYVLYRIQHIFTCYLHFYVIDALATRANNINTQRNVYGTVIMTMLLRKFTQFI